MDYTTEEVAGIFSAANDSKVSINALAYLDNLDNQAKEVIKEHVDLIEKMKGFKKEDGTTSIWTTQDFTEIDAAVTLGKSKL